MTSGRRSVVFKIAKIIAKRTKGVKFSHGQKVSSRTTLVNATSKVQREREDKR